MYIVYCDESGDDGYPKQSSPIFALCASYIHEDSWREAYNALKEFRRSLKARLPMKIEIHAKNFVLNKNPYRCLEIEDSERIAIIDQYCAAVSGLPIQIINVVINKTAITKDRYPVLDNAFSFSIRRVDNSTKNDNLLIITDEGRVVKMRKTARRVQVFDVIPSKFLPGVVVEKPIERLIEDPLPKSSANSYFVQVSDLVAFLVYNYMLLRVTKEKLNSRFPKEVNKEMIIHWLDIIEPVLNLKASSDNEHGYGIVCYPKH